MTGAPAIEVRDVTRNYGSVPALNGLSLLLPPGQVVALFGENGSGKTTLLKILAGVLAEYRGEVLIHGEAPGPQTKEIVSFLPDQSFLPDSITGRGAVEMYSSLFQDFDEPRATALIGELGIDIDRKLKALSKGQREKVQLALAMSRRAKIYLLDEPISGVDPAARETILKTILSQYEPDALVVISTHLISDIEPVADAAVFLRAGQVLMAGNADDLRSEHGMSLDQLFRAAYQNTNWS